MLARKLILQVIGYGCMASSWAVDLGTHKNCRADDQNFVLEQVGPTVSSPTKLAVASLPGNQVEIYVISRLGQVRRIEGAMGQMTLLGTLPVATNANEDGLIGIALDPKFASNRFLYFTYSYAGGGESTFRVARFKLAANGLLDMASEKVLLRINSTRGKWHTGGVMQFDAQGDLWISIGDNEQMEPGPGNTADLRGSILRIRPNDGDPRGYTIPPGNFGEFFSARYKAAGNAALAADYANPAKVRPEIYIKGTRNVYTLAADSVTSRVLFSEFGPDPNADTNPDKVPLEEYHIVKEPFYGGWPYFAARYTMNPDHLGGRGLYGQSVTVHDRANPVNSHPDIAGVRQLPPVHEALYERGKGCPMSGPLFRYDGRSASASAFPPQFDGRWLVADCRNASYGFHLWTLNAGGTAITQDLKIFSQLVYPGQIVDMEHGPDGILYFLSYDIGRLYRVRYTGTCRDPVFFPQPVGAARPLPLAEAAWFKVHTRSLTLAAYGRHTVEVLDLRGRTVLAFQGDEPGTYNLPAHLRSGIYMLRAETTHGLVIRKAMFSEGR